MTVQSAMVPAYHIGRGHFGTETTDAEKGCGTGSPVQAANKTPTRHAEMVGLLRILNDP
jgi:hypothetical protein